ncbi:MAG: hypothetical protein IJX12_02705 [Lachnospiraceae bacterium]|nr:hypothetical protein [Lachnospiraceae bacterium]
MNPMALMKIKGLFERFQTNHPKVPMFFKAASQVIGEDSIIEINVTTAEGKTLCTNMKVTKDDLELVEQLKQMM